MRRQPPIQKRGIGGRTKSTRESTMKKCCTRIMKNENLKNIVNENNNKCNRVFTHN